jgi:HK97 family phage major capsid protein/HK97 family phage prohead protease
MRGMSEKAIPDALSRHLEKGHAIRALQVARDAINEEARTATLAFASEEPYERFWGVEILDVSKKSMRMGRLKSGANLLCDHDTRDVVGVVESVEVGADKVARATVRFGRSARAEEVWNDVKDGIRRNVSVGYAIHAAQLVETKDGLETYRVTDWEPLEVSLVSVPADATVGVGRSLEQPPAEPTPQVIERSVPMSEAQAPAAAAVPPAIEVVAQRNHAKEISDIAKSMPGGAELALDAIQRGLTVEQFQREAIAKLSTAPVPTPDLGLTQKETRQYSLTRAVAAAANGNWSRAGFEREAHEAILKRTGKDAAPNGGFYVPYEVQKRDMTSAGASGSQYLVATDNLAGSFIDLLRNRSLVAQFGARMLTGLVGNVTIPKQTAASTAYWLSTEATAITESQPTIGQLAMTPKTVGAYTELSRLMLLQADPSADALVVDDLAKVLALGVDAAAIAGSGASGQPTGILSTSGIGSVTGTTLGYSGILEFQTDVAAANALVANCGYMTTPAVASLLSQRAKFSNTDTPLWTGNILDGQVSGFRAAATNQMSAATMVFGDWSQIVIGEWGTLEIAATNAEGSNFKAGIVAVRAFKTVDIGVRIAAAFSAASSIT